MSIQSAFRKIAVVAATAGCAVSATAGVASAAPAPHAAASVQVAPMGWWHHHHHHCHHLYKGLVIAHSGLLVRSGPTTHARVIGALPYHTVVRIRCKVNGQWVDGNPRWYKLADGHWAWASARYIVNLGPAPRWCHR